MQLAISFTIMFAHTKNKSLKGKTPYEARFGELYRKKAKLGQFGCRVTFIRECDKRRKFGPKGCEGVLIGPTDGAYLVLDLERYLQSGGSSTCLSMFAQ